MAVDEKRRLPVLPDTGVGRREVLQGLVGVGAGVALPDAAESLVKPSAIPAAQAKAKAADWKPQFLDAHQFGTLTALCARIVPGSDKALTDRFIDGLLAVDTRERQQRFLTALGAMEGAAAARFQQPFRNLTEDQQVEILTTAASGEPGRPEWIWTPGTVLKEPEPRPEVVTLRDQFDHIKRWIVEAYYSSEAGLQELGYTGQMFFLSFPDCDHPDHT